MRRVLGGAAIGLIVGVGASAGLWRARQGLRWPAGVAGGVVGAMAGLAAARRRRWADADVALYLDARLESDEAIATAVDLPPEDPAHGIVLSQAAAALDRATPEAVRAPALRPWHVAIPLAAAAIAGISIAPLPRPPAGTEGAPGAGQVRLAQVAGLEKVMKLAEAHARDEAQRERLKKLAEEARQLREKLRAGMEKREALADIARLKDGLREERLSLGDGDERRGMEAALGKLGGDKDLRNAQRALGDRDLVRLDEEMEQLADRLESEGRRRAQETLEEAAEAARRNGAPGVARALEQEKKRLAELAKKADRLRALGQALGDALGEEGKKALRDFDERGTGKDAQRLAEALADALDKLTPEQQKQLEERLKQKAKPDHDPGEGADPRGLKDLADQLDTPEGRKQLADALRKMAEAPPPGSDEGDGQRGLDDAEEGADDAEKDLGGVPIPIPIPGAGSPGEPGGAGKDPSSQGGPGKDRTPGSGSGGGGEDGTPVAGHTEGGGRGSHQGKTNAIEGDGVRARAEARLNRGRPMPGVVLGRSEGRAGDTANVVGQGGLGRAAAGEIGAVDRSSVPEEYKEQIGRYFQPK
jgi:hypothetical protein